MQTIRCGRGSELQHDAYHLAYRHALDVASDGQTLAMAATTELLWVSSDADEGWHGMSLDACGGDTAVCP